MTFMKMISTVTVAAAATVATAGVLSAASVNIYTEAGTEYVTYHGIRDDTQTRGGDLIGMEITAIYADDTVEDLVWGAVGNTFGVIGSGLSLTFKSIDWNLSTTVPLLSLILDAGSANAMYDTLKMSDGDTPTTYGGSTFNIRDENLHEGEVNVTYRNEIRLGGDDPVGDVYSLMFVDFSHLLTGGLLGDMIFNSDLDSLRYAGDLAPVPLPGGLPLMASGIFLLGLSRRRKS